MYKRQGAVFAGLRFNRPARPLAWALFGAGIGLLLIVFAITLYGRSLDLQSAFSSAIPWLDPAILTGYFQALFKGVESMTLKLSAALGLSGLIIVFITRNRKIPI